MCFECLVTSVIVLYKINQFKIIINSYKFLLHQMQSMSTYFVDSLFRRVKEIQLFITLILIGSLDFTKRPTYNCLLHAFFSFSHTYRLTNNSFLHVFVHSNFILLDYLFVIQPIYYTKHLTLTFLPFHFQEFQLSHIIN